MYYIERIPLTDAVFLAGSIGEPAGTEKVWAPGTYAVGAEVIRPALHRVFKCAIARTASDTKPPEEDKAAWADMRFTDRWTPFGPFRRSDGKMVYESRALELTAGDIEYRLKLRYANAIALFGLAGAQWSVDVFNMPQADGGTLQAHRVGIIKAPATGFWSYAYGQRHMRDRVLVTDLPIFPNAEIRIKISASAGQMRRVTQIEVGKLRFIPGIDWGGTGFGLRRSPRAFTFRKEEPDGSSTTLLYGNTYDMSGAIHLRGRQEDQALAQLRNLLGKGVAYTPALLPGYEQSLVFGTLESADTARDNAVNSTVSFQIRGLPTG